MQSQNPNTPAMFVADTPGFGWKRRLRASSIHAGLSLAIAALAAGLVFLVWYPYPYRELAGGRELFLILIGVDVTLGPLITFAIFNRLKPWPVLRRDLVVVCTLQLAALAYGMWTVFEARPVYMVFEYNRFRVVHAVDIPRESLEQAAPEWRDLPLSGPRPLALRPFEDSNEGLSATITALQGVSLSAQPDLWQPYGDARQQILEAAKPALPLKQRFAEMAEQIDAALLATGRPPESLLYLPIVARKSFWTALIDGQTAELVGYIPLDSF